MALVATIPVCTTASGAATVNSFSNFIHDTLNSDANFTVLKQAGATAGEDLMKIGMVHADYDDIFVLKRSGTTLTINYDPLGTVDIDTGTGVISGGSVEASGDAPGNGVVSDRNGTVTIMNHASTVNSLTMGTTFYSRITDVNALFIVMDSTNQYVYWGIELSRVGARRFPIVGGEKHGVGFLAGQVNFVSSTGDFFVSSTSASRIYLGNGHWRRPYLSNSDSVRKFVTAGNYTSPVPINIGMQDVDSFQDSPWGQLCCHAWIDGVTRNTKQKKESATTNQCAMVLHYNSTAVAWGALWNKTQAIA